MMVFGLKNAPTMFMMLMDSVLRPYLDKFAIVFLDDLLIYSAFKEEHLDNLKLVFKFLKKNSLYSKESNATSFKQKSIT